MKNRAERLEWLKSLRSIERAEGCLHLLGVHGDEHLRDATEAWLEHHRTFAAMLDRRIKLESGRSQGREPLYAAI